VGTSSGCSNFFHRQRCVSPCCLPNLDLGRDVVRIIFESATKSLVRSLCDFVNPVKLGEAVVTLNEFSANTTSDVELRLTKTKGEGVVFYFSFRKV
jgi:hypothetical protein